MTGPRPLTAVGIALVGVSFGFLLVVGLTSAVAYYVTPTELASRGGDGAIRLYGIVEAGSIRWDAPGSTLSFQVTDGITTVAVTSTSLPAGIFQDGIGVVLAGRSHGPGQFVADEILVKHSQVYVPLAPGATLPPSLVDTIRGGVP